MRGDTFAGRRAESLPKLRISIELFKRLGKRCSVTLNHAFLKGFSEVSFALWRGEWTLEQAIHWVSMPVVRQAVAPELDGAAFRDALAERIRAPLDTVIPERWYLFSAR